MNTQYITKGRVLTVLAVVIAMVGVAAASSYVTKTNLEADNSIPPAYMNSPANTNNPANRPAHHVAQSAPKAQQLASATPQTPRCNDNNVLGTIAGGAVGGILGNQVGRGSGKTVATIGGTLGGAYLGNQYVPLQNATCRN